MLNDHDAYKPAEIAALIEQVGVAKARLPLGQMLTLAVLAGAFISFGTAGYLMVMTGADAGFGPQRLLGGVVFSLGLILVIVGGAELFTGNALMVMAAVDGKIGLGALLRNWGGSISATCWAPGGLRGLSGLVGWRMAPWASPPRLSRPPRRRAAPCLGW